MILWVYFIATWGYPVIVLQQQICFSDAEWYIGFSKRIVIYVLLNISNDG